MITTTYISTQKKEKKKEKSFGDQFLLEGGSGGKKVTHINLAMLGNVIVGNIRREQGGGRQETFILEREGKKLTCCRLQCGAFMWGSDKKSFYSVKNQVLHGFASMKREIICPQLYPFS